MQVVEGIKKKIKNGNGLSVVAKPIHGQLRCVIGQVHWVEIGKALQGAVKLVSRDAETNQIQK